MTTHPCYEVFVRNEEDTYYDAVAARDYRFDGKFFVGVKTTGVYCRPICPARPNKGNIIFFPDAQSAEKAGFRPCLRCRPESAPLSPAWSGSSTTIHRALKLIAGGRLAGATQDDIAGQLGMSARHLRRLFTEELGKTPNQIWAEYRLNFARTLIAETGLPMTEIAFSAGFSSLRRFNEAFKARFRRTPTELRRERRPISGDMTLRLRLSYRPLLDWNALLTYYQSHLIAGVENVKDNRYERVFSFGDAVGALRVSRPAGSEALELEVVTTATRHLYRIVQNVRRMFDLDSDPLLMANAFSQSPFMSALSEKYPGLRLAQRWDPFESAVFTILGQVVSVDHAMNLVGQLVKGCGTKIRNPLSGDTAYLFPRPETVADAPLADIQTTEARKETLRTFSRQISTGKLRLDSEQDPMAFRDSLLRIKGIGTWTADDIRLRALGDPDAFPADDLILKRALARHPEIRMETFKPWRGYAALYLWKEYAQILSQKRRRSHEIVL